MSGDEDTDKWARKFIREADDFVAGKRRKYPMELGRPLYVEPKPKIIRHGMTPYRVGTEAVFNCIAHGIRLGRSNPQRICDVEGT